MGEWLPPQAPGGSDPPTRWDDAPPRPPESPALAPAPPPSQHQQVQFARPVAATPSNGQAVAALVLGIVGISLLVISAGLGFILSLPCSILAWIYGARGKRRAKEPGQGGHGQAQAGFIMGIVGVVIAVLAAAFWIVLLLTADESFWDDLEQDQQDPFDFSSIRLAAAVLRALAAALV